MRPVRRAAAALTLAAPVLIAPLPDRESSIALAQPLSGATVEASISQRFEADSNYDLDPDPAGTSFFSDTRFGFDMVSGTETQTLRLGFDVGLRALWEADEDFELTYADPAIGFARYEQEWADATFDGYMRLARRRLSVQSPLDVPGFDIPPTLPPDDLTEFDGTERRFDTGFDLALRTDAPSSYRLGFDYTNFDYSDIPAGDAESTAPRYRYTATALWTLRFAPVLSSAVLAEYEYGKADNAVENEISVSSLDVGLIYEPSEVLRIATGVGYADRTRNNTIDGETVEIEHDRGPEARAGFVYDLTDFTLEANARVTTAAPETRWTGDFGLQYELPRGEIFARGYRDYGGNNLGNEVLIYGAQFGLTRDINTLSRVGLDLIASNQIDQEEGGEPDINQASLTARYIYDLTSNVSTTLGYRLRLRDEGEDGSATSNAVFWTIGRSFFGTP
jgi:hypothetical protein